MNELEQVVTRWARAARPATDLGDRVVFSGGELRLQRGAPGVHGWRVHGRLRPAGHVRRGTRVELAVTPLADRAEVTLRPTRLRRVWSPSQERRYFDLAHDAASAVATALTSGEAA